MIVFVDIEHPRLKADEAVWQQSLAMRMHIKYRLEDICGQPCLVVRYPHATPAFLRDLGVRAVFVSGNRTDWEHYSQEDLQGLREVFRAAAWPTFGFCGGAQLMAAAFEADLGPLGPQRPGDPLPPPELDRSPGMRQERGFMPLRVAKLGPLFQGLPADPVFYQSHYWEVKNLPPGFTLYASTDLCALQAFGSEDRLLFGTQFHPELYDEDHPDGRRLLENFAALAGLRRRTPDTVSETQAN